MVLRGAVILCINPHCRSVGRHRPDCQTQCWGCLPRIAADGRNLCEVCTRRLAEDAHTAAALYTALERVLTTTARPGPSVSGTRNHGLELNPTAAECRTLIRHRLVSWCLLIAEERGWTPPQDTIEALAQYVATCAVWLSAHPAAGDAADEFRDLAHGQPWRTAYPSGARSYPVGTCPDCAGTIHAVIRDTDALLPSVLTCDTTETHTWPADTWRALGRRLNPTTAARFVTAHEVATIWRVPLGTVWWLASTHAWPRNTGRPVHYLAAAVDATMAWRARVGT